jgi:hypothetical protein
MACRPTRASRGRRVAWAVAVWTTWASSVVAQGGVPAPVCSEKHIPRPVIDVEAPSYLHVPVDVDVRIRLELLERLDVDISSIISGEVIAPDGGVFTGVARLDPRERSFDEVVWHPDIPLEPGEYEFVLQVEVGELPDCQREPAETTTIPLTVLDQTIEEVIAAFDITTTLSQAAAPTEPDCCPIADCTAGACTQCWKTYTQIQHIFDWFEVPGGYYLNVTVTPDLPAAEPVSSRGTQSAFVYSPMSFCADVRYESAGDSEAAGTLEACTVDTLPDELPPPGGLQSVYPESCAAWPSSVPTTARTIWAARAEHEADALAAIGVIVGGAPGSGGTPATGGETMDSGGTGGAAEARSGCVAVPTPAGSGGAWAVFLLLAAVGAARRAGAP